MFCCFYEVPVYLTKIKISGNGYRDRVDVQLPPPFKQMSLHLYYRVCDIRSTKCCSKDQTFFCVQSTNELLYCKGKLFRVSILLNSANSQHNV